MNKKMKSLKLPFTIAVLFVLSNLIMGCTSCILSENKNISATKEVSRKLENYGLTVHYNITVNIKNIGNNLAKSSKIETFYCNNLIIGHDCHNQTYNIGDLDPNETVQRYFEYDIDVLRDATLGEYTLQYHAMSC